MMQDSVFIATIDHRISAAIVFFVLLLMLFDQQKRPHFPVRALISLLCMSLGSWLVRTLADEVFTGLYLQAFGYSLQILLLVLLFISSATFCYHIKAMDAQFTSILALTIFKIAWNVFKCGSSIKMIASIDLVWSTYSLFGSLISYFVYFLVCFLLCTIYRRIVQGGVLHSPPASIYSLSAVFVLCQMGLEFCGHVFTGTSSALFLYYFCALLYTIINYVALVMMAMLDSFRHENKSMQDFINNKMRYYEMSHEGIVSLQTKCHDLKHQITAIRSEAGKNSFNHYLDELQTSIDEYGTVIECGNQTVDIVLTEKNILCSASQVSFSYMINGALFDFLTDREIYSLFGNALDNALEAVAKLQNPADRRISLKSNTRGNLVVLQVENTFDGTLDLSGGLPRTTKHTGSHGFGVRSIQEIARKHGGDMSIRAEGSIFKLSVILNPEP